MIRIITWVVIVIMVMVIISEVPNLCVVNVSEVYLIDYCSTVLHIIPSLQVVVRPTNFPQYRYPVMQAELFHFN